MEELTTIIGQYGFPMAVAAFLLIRLDNRLKEMTEAVHELIAASKGGSK